MEESSRNYSLKGKFAFIFTKEFLLINVLGQFLALCITATIVTSTELFNRNAIFPVTQSALTYFTLLIIYTPITLYQSGFEKYVEMLKERGWKYIILAIIDVEGNYFVVKAYNYTSPLSITLLDAWTIPVVVILTVTFLKVKYHWSQYLGVAICLAGIGLVIRGDFESGNRGDMLYASQPVLGDIFCIIGATFYGLSNILEEYFVRKRPFYEVVGQMGLWGTIVSVIQLSITERDQLRDTPWDGSIVGFFLAYNIAMVCLYTVAPILFRIASATFFNLSLLTSDFYSLIFNIFLFNSLMTRFYPAAFVFTVVGLITYYVYPAAQPDISPEDDFVEKHVREEDIENGVGVNNEVIPEGEKVR